MNLFWKFVVARSFQNSSHLVVDHNLGLLLVHHGVLHHGVNDNLLLHHGVNHHGVATHDNSTTTSTEDLLINWVVGLGVHKRANVGGEHKQEEDGNHGAVPVSDSMSVEVFKVVISVAVIWVVH